MSKTADFQYYKRKIFLVCATTVFLTFCMVVLGGVVKSTGSSLACPDWQSCLNFIPSTGGQLAIQEAHRLLGAVLGILSCVLVFLSLMIRKQAPALHKACMLAFVLVVIQGAMGVATVLTQITPLYSTIHLMLSHLYFAVLLFIFFKTCDDRKWPRSNSEKLIKLSAIGALLVFIQILLGGVIHHYGAGAACGLGWENAILCQELTTEKLTFWPLNAPGRLHMFHRINGILTLFALIGLTIPCLKYARINKLKSLKRHLIGIHIVVTVQVLIGIKVIGTHIAPLGITLHLAFGLLLWALVVSLFLKIRGATLK